MHTSYPEADPRLNQMVQKHTTTRIEHELLVDRIPLRLLHDLLLAALNGSANSNNNNSSSKECPRL